MELIESAEFFAAQMNKHDQNDEHEFYVKQIITDLVSHIRELESNISKANKTIALQLKRHHEFQLLYDSTKKFKEECIKLTETEWCGSDVCCGCSDRIKLAIIDLEVSVI